MPDLRRFSGITHVFLERARKRADASFNPWRDQLRQQIEEQVGVSESLRRTPIGQINVFLYSSAVEAAKRESVDGENVAVILAQPALEFEQGDAIAQFESR